MKVIVSKSLIENIPICSIVISATKTDVSELPFIFFYFLGYQISIRIFIMETLVSVMVHRQCTEILDQKHIKGIFDETSICSILLHTGFHFFGLERAPG